MSQKRPKSRHTTKAIVPQKTGNFAKGGSEEWEVPVWQFVRVMVQLEKNISGKSTGLWKANQESWEELDQVLGVSGEDDFDTFVQLMMNTQVTIHLPDSVSKKALNFTLNSLLTSMRRRVKLMSKSTEERKDMEFEISELDKLHRRLMPVEEKLTSNKAYQPKRFRTENKNGNGK